MTRPAGSWPPISTRSLGSVMRWRFWQHAVKRECLRSLSAPAPVMAVMSGSSFRNRYLHPRRGSSVPMVQSTTTSANPDNIVVPLSAIIDQLQGKLSSADINALLYAIVAKKKNEVRPGDLISAELM